MCTGRDSAKLGTEQLLGIWTFYRVCGCCSVTKSCVTVCEPIDYRSQALSPSTISQSLLKFISIESAMPSNHLILCNPFLHLLSIFPSISVFSNESALWFRWPKYWNFSFSINSSKLIPRLISFRIDWCDLLTVQGTPQESSPTPKFKSINSLARNPLYRLTLSSIHGYWKNLSFDHMDFCWQSKVSAFY